MSFVRELQAHVAEVSEHQSLGQLNPLGLGGVATYAAEVHDAGELAAAVDTACKHNLPYVVIGEGSSVLFADGGFPGLVITNKASGMTMAADRSQAVVESGMLLATLANRTVAQGYGGILPFAPQGGTVGGAACTNLTVAGERFRASIRQVTLLQPPTKLKAASVVRKDAAILDKLTQPRFGLEPHAVLLTLQLQLTSRRPDVLTRELADAYRAYQAPPKGAFGPVFHVNGSTADAERVLRGLRGEVLRHSEFQLDRRHPSFVRRRGIGGTAASLWAWLEEVQGAANLLSEHELSISPIRLGAW